MTPKLSRLGVLTVPSNPAQRELLGKALPSAAQRTSVTLLPLPVQGPGDLPGAFHAARLGRADGLYVLGDVLTFIHRTRILDLVAKSRLPAMYTTRSAAEAGGLMSYGPNMRELFRARGHLRGHDPERRQARGAAVEHPRGTKSWW